MRKIWSVIFRLIYIIYKYGSGISGKNINTCIAVKILIFKLKHIDLGATFG